MKLKAAGTNMVKPGKKPPSYGAAQRSGRLCCGRIQVLGFLCTRDDLPDTRLIISNSPTPSRSPPKHADGRLVRRNTVALWVVELLHRLDPGASPKAFEDYADQHYNTESHGQVVHAHEALPGSASAHFWRFQPFWQADLIIGKFKRLQTQSL
jgi:hypothetical protein